jgi:hypothetical protein
MQSRFTSAVLGVAVFVLATGIAEAQTQPKRIGGHPNLNGIWQAMNSANWNLEAHAASALDQFWRLGAIGAVPAGQSVVKEGKIPYKPDALAKRDENRANWPKTDRKPRATCRAFRAPRICRTRSRSCKATATSCSRTRSPRRIVRCT